MGELMAIDRAREPSPEEVAAGLKPEATTEERVQALLSLGIYVSELAEVCGISISGLRNWTSGDARPRRSAAIALDRLRVVAAILVQAGLEDDRVGHWLRALDPDTQSTPLELLPDHAATVVTSATALLVKQQLIA
jgi:transcriptional regulator with XRE-family HTH domain